MSVFIVAEAGVNHLGDRAKMLALCDAAKACGSDAVKFQAYNTAKLIERRGKGDRDLLAKCELTDEDLDAIAGHCNMIGLKWFASVFDPSQIERVLSRGACALKIGHAEANWQELREACMSAGDLRHPVYISNGRIVDLPYVHSVLCVEEYPAKSRPNLGSIGRQWYAVRGFSSHYTDYYIPAAAALRGAEYIEAHLKLSDTDPEAAWSLSPFEFGKMVELIREYEGWL